MKVDPEFHIAHKRAVDFFMSRINPAKGHATNLHPTDMIINLLTESYDQSELHEEMYARALVSLAIHMAVEMRTNSFDRLANLANPSIWPWEAP